MGVRVRACLLGLVLVGIVVFVLSPVIPTTGWYGLLWLGLAGVACWRALRVALLAENGTVVVRNFWRTYRFKWSDVLDIAPSAYVIGGGRGAVVRTADSGVRNRLLSGDSRPYPVYGLRAERQRRREGSE